MHELYRALRTRVYRFIFRMVRDPSLAEDLVADVFLSFWNGSLHQNLAGSYRA